MSVSARFQARLAEQGFTPDHAQERAAAELDRLLAEIQSLHRPPTGQSSLLRWLRPHRRSSTPRGVYLWGGVGRGKTMLVDLFVECVGQRVRRSHFHRFMHDAHARLRALRAEAHEDPVATVATELADGLDVLCFDELYVNDIADAMIIGGLFEGLNDAGVTLVVTSNVAPRQLYRDGLQRSRFLPTIDLLERVTVVAEVDAGIDYRLRRLERAPMTVRSSPDSELWLSERFDGLARPDARSSGCIQIEGRPVAYRRMHAGIVWFDFKALCEGPRGTDDYIEIARQFDTVLISDVPVLGGDDNAARRFVALVDEFYERGVKLLLSTAGAFEQLYTGERLAFEFRRTVSRLIEMQSHAYLARPHLP